MAVLGFVMTAAFAYSLRQSFATLNLNAGVVRELRSNVSMLVALDAQTEVDSQTAAAMRSVIADAFVFGFRLNLLLCAVLAIASAGVAWRKISAVSRKGLQMRMHDSRQCPTDTLVLVDTFV